MSYNNTKINTSIKPDSSGNITVNTLDSLNNVTISSISNDHTLNYNGSIWVNGTIPTSSKEYIFIGEGSTQAYSDSGASGDITVSSPNHVIRVYDSSPINTISGASFTYKDNSSSTNWVISITLPTGKYNAIAQTRFEFSAAGYFTYNVSSNADSSLTPKATIGEDNSAASGHEGSPSTVQGYFELSNSTAVFLKMHNASNVDAIAYQGTSGGDDDTTTPNIFPSEHTFLYIEKIG